MNFIEAVKALEEDKKVFRTMTIADYEGNEQHTYRCNLIKTPHCGYGYSTSACYEEKGMICWEEKEIVKDDILSEAWEVEI